MKTYCTKEKALQVIDAMNDHELNKFIKKCPARVQMLVKSGLVDWRDILANWYMIIPF